MGDFGSAAAAVGVTVWLIVLCAYDFRHRRLPNALTVPGAVVILSVAAVCGHGVAAALGAVALSTIYAAVHLVAPAAMGAGDVKLAVGLGALTGVFGPDVWVLAAVGASLLTAVLALGLRLCGAGPTVPHGPSMCLSSAAVLTLALCSQGL
ncbi:prepilin peptidase [Mycolicibacterium vaccae]|uniref:Peptidase A24A, prepilin type IV n=1 Tax=Mycolicibacterium vaccae ATCC 25954 TaxID=1194972 RepID=K0UCJ3_MYCVA|nr:A24 family peptidase [Mycolicibacterium vaccae]ANI39721.1 peptidase A24 [Mycolicibacterium vaccae 95051]EJZ04952.1 peptidase A24A, prepilin type IV [Mycolicibacterium vaccae ATCC 25954]MCV7063488.1 prepilin peptidase [Mycolicibacterium vaccae]